jgi:hypothetical protein
MADRKSGLALNQRGSARAVDPPMARRGIVSCDYPLGCCASQITHNSHLAGFMTFCPSFTFHSLCTPRIRSVCPAKAKFATCIVALIPHALRVKRLKYVATCASHYHSLIFRGPDAPCFIGVNGIGDSRPRQDNHASVHRNSITVEIVYVWLGHPSHRHHHPEPGRHWSRSSL